jgi:hypothetical protein
MSLSNRINSILSCAAHWVWGWCKLVNVTSRFIWCWLSRTTSRPLRWCWCIMLEANYQFGFTALMSDLAGDHNCSDLDWQGLDPCQVRAGEPSASSRVAKYVPAIAEYDLLSKMSMAYISVLFWSKQVWKQLRWPFALFTPTIFPMMIGSLCGGTRRPCLVG